MVLALNVFQSQLHSFVLSSAMRKSEIAVLEEYEVLRRITKFLHAEQVVSTDVCMPHLNRIFACHVFCV